MAEMLTWRVSESDGLETAWLDLGGGTLRARGRAAGLLPQPYWLSYELETGADFVTRRLRVTAETAAGVRELDLRRAPDGGWTAGAEPLEGLDGALDCDLGLCPVTNTMPVLRHGLHQGGSERTFLMAWVRVPDLTVLPSVQTYTHLAPRHVRYASGGYRADLVLDEDGLVVEYPGMAARVERRPLPASSARLR
ncbi:putative glycolipid-binding domain-containing protein [Streptomyces sp. V4-01]|uniref:Glycolipid-binding domain-containing protein n=1 Tax=Actinacidiphila polyblastidii TaxID=3110430 RepID=A0ABU7PD08_9ACTN|nr:putative glycolipid-binding domain-containing protein [Streptomyces sp. V4-01]